MRTFQHTARTYLSFFTILFITGKSDAIQYNYLFPAVLLPFSSILTAEAIAPAANIEDSTLDDSEFPGDRNQQSSSSSLL